MENDQYTEAIVYAIDVGKSAASDRDGIGDFKGLSARSLRIPMAAGHRAVIASECSVACIGDRRQQRELRLTRVQAGMLHDDRDVGLNHTGEIPVPRHRLGVVHVVERSEEHTSELQSLMRISYAVF